MGLLRFSYRSEILSLHTNITVTLPSEELTYYPLTDIKREEGVAARRKWEYRDGMKFQTVYLLHGGGEDGNMVWITFGSSSVRNVKYLYPYCVSIKKLSFTWAVTVITQFSSA